MTLRDRLEVVAEQAQLAEPARSVKHPTGWEPGVLWEPMKGGSITSGPLGHEPDDAIWKELIADWGLDPSKIEIIPGTVQVRGWDAGIGGGEVKRMKYYKASLRPATSDVLRIDLEPLYKEALKARKGKKVMTGEATLLIALSDFQVGNCDFGGLEAQLAALANIVASIPERVKQLAKQGIHVGTICIAGMGDLIENTCGFYAAQPFRVEVDLREQRKIVRRAIKDIIVAAVNCVENVSVICVPGNHGEARQDGKSITRVGDNYDVAVFEEVYEILEANPEVYGHVKWRIPHDEMAIAVELSGQRVAFTHGHAARGGNGNAGETMWKWWANQAMGRRYPGVADATILISGHFHHLNVKQQQGRTVFVCPSLTQVSEYWADSFGVLTTPGVLSMVIDETGWSELKLL